VDAGAVETIPDGDDGSPAAVPGVYRGPGGRPGPVLFRLAVDGELFAVREGGDGGTVYDWLSGLNDGYGFGSTGSPARSVDEHWDAIRSFLADIDPTTAFLGDV
jgi:hypothetical protein